MMQYLLYHSFLPFSAGRKRFSKKCCLRGWVISLCLGSNEKGLGEFLSRGWANSAFLFLTCKCIFSYYVFFLWRTIMINPLSANTTKCSNTLKQFVGNLPTNCSRCLTILWDWRLEDQVVKCKWVKYLPESAMW